MSTQEPTTTSPTSETPTRRPYHGSCHCGLTKYLAYITLPPPIIHADPPRTATTRIRKCNCSTCHKMSFFHVRLMDSPNDFFLLSPSNLTELKDYTCFDQRIHWYFCPTCGVRCFAHAGEGEIVEKDIEGMGIQKVWKPKTEGWVESETGYLSVNGVTLEPDQEGLDMREWTEKGWIAYLDTRGESLEGCKPATMDRPHDGGMY